MASTFYIDPENGNDANDGSSWANAWKTWTLGATAARITAGDTIRIAKSPDAVDSGVNGTWTANSDAVTLSSALTLDISDCDSDWAPSANVTRTTQTGSTYLTEGSACQQFVFASGFTTGLVAYLALAETDFSAYENISFVISSNADVAASVFQICLCSDNAGATPVDSFTIDVPIGYDGFPAYYQTVLTYKKGSALGSSIQSVALYALSDPGTVTIYLDNIIACNDFSLNSLVGKSGDVIYPIKNITGGTTVTIGVVGYCKSRTMYYRGASETVAFYYRNSFRGSIIATATDTVSESIKEAGTSGNLITFSGGWNTSTTEQDGMTYYDGLSMLGYGISFGGLSYTKVENCGFVRYYYGIYFYKNGSALDISLEDIDCLGCHARGVHLEAALVGYFYRLTISGALRLITAMGYGLALKYISQAIISANITSYTLDANTILVGTCTDVYFTGDCTIGGIQGIGTATAILRLEDSTNVYVKKLIAKNSTNAGFIKTSNCKKITIDYIYLDSDVYKDLFTYSSGIDVRVGYLDINGHSIIEDLVDLTGTSSVYHGVSIDAYGASNRWETVLKFGVISDQVTGGQAEAWAYGGSGTCLYMNPASATYPLPYKMYAPVTASTSYKLQMQVKKTSSAADCTLKVRRISGCGVTAVYDESVTLTDSWAEFNSTTFTPSRSGFVEIELWAYDGATTGDIGVDNLTLVTV